MGLATGGNCPICNKRIPVGRYFFGMGILSFSCPHCHAPVRFSFARSLKFILPAVPLILGFFALAGFLHRYWIAFFGLATWVLVNAYIVFLNPPFVSDWSNTA